LPKFLSRKKVQISKTPHTQKLANQYKNTEIQLLHTEKQEQKILSENIQNVLGHVRKLDKI